MTMPLIRSTARLLHTATGRTLSVPTAQGSVNSPEAFLKSIGRGCDEHAGKFETWEKLFTTSSRTMKNDMAIATKQRKYILSWLERFRQGKPLCAVSLPKKK